MTTDATGEVLVLDEAFFADRNALYSRVRDERRPVVRAVNPNGLTTWLVTRYEDARAALNDPRLSKDVLGARDVLAERLGREVVASEGIADNMLNSDPPDHTRLRKLVGKAFTRQAIERLRPRIEELAVGLADAMEEVGPSVDLLDAFAFPLPMSVICELLGVPPDHRDDFRGWSNTILSGAGADERRPAAEAMSGFLEELVADKAAHPADDMLSQIVRAREDGDALSARETIGMAFLLLVAGHETTVNLIGNGMLALLRHPDQHARLRADPTLVPAAVEEFLRYDGPVDLATFRFTTEPVTIGGTTIPAGEVVYVSLLGANRDPGRFTEPDRLDVTRQATGHLGFGHGIHHCLGAPLARLEGEVAFRVLLDRFPQMTLDGPPGRYRMSTIMNGLTALPVRLTPGIAA